MKKIVSICVAVLFLFSMFVPQYAHAALTETSVTLTANESVQGDMTIIDVLVAAHLFMYSPNQEDNLWPSTVTIRWVIPLYSSGGDIIAWYLEFMTGQYAVVNNNIDNPCVIEYGGSSNQYVSNILDNGDYFIIYSGPGMYSNYHDEVQLEEMSLSNDVTTTLGLYDNYPTLAIGDAYLRNMLAENKRIIVTIQSS